jgi:hypothetical protein
MLSITKTVTRTVYPYQYSSLRRLLKPRRFQAYCLGTNKSGTHSIANIFAQNYKSGHEEAHGTLINGYLDWQEGKIKEKDFRTILTKHDKYAWLEMDSSHVHIEYVDLLVKLFPKAKFILTIRDCYSWLDSHLNHCLNHPLYDCWARLHHWRYGQTSFHYDSREKILQDYGFLPLKNYFTAWSNHNYRALSLIPSERLLILRTSEISTSTDHIADFLGISEDTLDKNNTHSFQATKKYNLLCQINSDYLRKTAEEHCGLLMSKFFSHEDHL